MTPIYLLAAFLAGWWARALWDKDEPDGLA